MEEALTHRWHVCIDHRGKLSVVRLPVPANDNFERGTMKTLEIKP